MFKKSTAFLMSVLIASFHMPLSSAVSAYEMNISINDIEIKAAPVSENYLDYLENPDDYFIKPSNLDASNLAEIEVVNNLPESFDMRSQGLVSPVKNQMEYGTCWAHGAVSSMETSLISQNPLIDISEWHMAYFCTVNANGTDITDFEELFSGGGTSSMIANKIIGWQGITNESDFPYEYTEIANEDYRYMTNYHVSDIYTPFISLSNSNDTNQRVKDFIYDGQSMTMSFIAYDKFLNEETSSYYGDLEQLDEMSELEAWSSLHEVAIIGWDDNYSKENFRSDIQPQNDGAWLIKNSWSSELGDNGYYWVSYEDTTLTFDVSYKLNYSDDYDNIYQNDFNVNNLNSEQLMPFAYSVSDNNEGYMSNIFTAENNEYISGAGFFTTDNGTEYEVTIYTDLQEEANPISGTAHYAASGTEKYSGYHTIDFDDSIYIESGEKYSIVVKLKNPVFNYTIPTTQLNLLPEDSENLNLENISFVSADGENWIDSTNYEYEDVYNADIGIVCCKVFTNNADKIEFSDYAPYVYDDENIELTADNGQDIYYSTDNNNWQIYNEPISIDEATTIYASFDENGENSISHTYAPKSAFLSSLYYIGYSTNDIPVIKDGAIINDITTVINGDLTEISIVPVATNNSTITINGDIVESGTPYTFNVNDVNQLNIVVSDENNSNTEYTINIERQFIDFTNEMLLINDDELSVTAPDGTPIYAFYSISDYIGQTLKAEYKDGSGSFDIEIPERAAAPDDIEYTINYTIPAIEFNQEVTYWFENQTEPIKYTNKNDYAFSLTSANGHYMYCSTPATTTAFHSEPVSFFIPELPDAPECELTINEITDNSISIEPIDIDGIEYGIAMIYDPEFYIPFESNEQNAIYLWSDSPVFENISSGTDYYIAVRYPSVDGKAFSKVTAIKASTTGLKELAHINYFYSTLEIEQNIQTITKITDSEGNVLNMEEDYYISSIDITPYIGQTLTIENINDNYTYELQIPEKPECISDIKINYKNREFDIVTNGKSLLYSTDNCETWIPITNDEDVFSIVIPDLSVDCIYFKNSSTVTEFESIPMKIDIPKIPSINFNLEIESNSPNSISIKPIEGAEFSLCEYDSDFEIKFSDTTDFTNLQADTYYNLFIRIKATDSAFSSDLSRYIIKTPADENSDILIYSKSDLDGDGKITSYDALIILQHTTGLITIDDMFYCFADNDLTSDITSYDALMTLQHTTGLIDIIK